MSRPEGFSRIYEIEGLCCNSVLRVLKKKKKDHLHQTNCACLQETIKIQLLTVDISIQKLGRVGGYWSSPELQAPPSSHL